MGRIIKYTPKPFPSGHLTAVFRVIQFSFAVLVLTSCGRKAPNISPPIEKIAIPAKEYEEGIASWYGRPFHGRLTANGETYDMEAPTAAHKTLPFNSNIRVLNLDNGRSTNVRINDRGPFVKGRILDLSKRAAREIKMLGPGTARVRLHFLGSKSPPPPKDPSQGYTIQVGAFRTFQVAEKLRKKLAKNYKDVIIKKVDSRRGALHLVRLLSFSSRTDAQKLVRLLLKKKIVPEAIVVKR
jgi:rare lipoprotein A